MDNKYAEELRSNLELFEDFIISCNKIRSLEKQYAQVKDKYDKIEIDTKLKYAASNKENKYNKIIEIFDNLTDCGNSNELENWICDNFNELAYYPVLKHLAKILNKYDAYIDFDNIEIKIEHFHNFVNDCEELIYGTSGNPIDECSIQLYKENDQYYLSIEHVFMYDIACKDFRKSTNNDYTMTLEMIEYFRK